MKKKPSRLVIWSTLMVLSLAISFFYNMGILAWPYNNYSDSWGRPMHYDGTGLVGTRIRMAHYIISIILLILTTLSPLLSGVLRLLP